MKKKPNNPYAVLFSILTACAIGGVVAATAIAGTEYVFTLISSTTNNNVKTLQAMQNKKSDNSNSAATYSSSEEEEVSTFVSDFSRVFIYSADNGEKIIENAKKSLPRAAKNRITSKAYAVIDIDRNTIVVEKNLDKVLPIASITKLVTAVIAKKLFEESDTIIVTKQALLTYGNEARLREGEKFKTLELLYPLLMVSSNDSAEALALAYPKGRTMFMAEMNNFVRSIGAKHTFFRDASGLSSDNVSTAGDLSIIFKWVFDNEPELLDITLLKSKTIRTHTWINPTHFLNLDSYAGGKNGYTPEANRTSLALFKLGRMQRHYGVVLLDSGARDSDILDLLEAAVR